MSPCQRHQQLAQAFKRVLSTYQEAEDLINIGAYVKGSNPSIDYAISKIVPMVNYLRQGPSEKSSLPQSVAALHHLLGDLPQGL